MYRVVIKQLQLSFLSVLVLSLSLSFLTSAVLFDFLFLSFSFYPSLPLSPLFTSSFSFSPVLSSFWTLSRCACGNFPGVIFAALLARSLTSLSSVYPHRHFSRGSLRPAPLPRRVSSSPFPASRSYSRPVSRFSFPRATSSDVAEAPHLSTCAPLRFPFHFRFYRVTSPGYFVPDGDGGRLFSQSNGKV